jgi:MoaA/NifB/PqqE/SkfB family radical SAM enzyme
MVMKNPFTAKLGLADRLFPLVVRLPSRVRNALAGLVSQSLRRRIQAGGFPDRLHLFLTGRCNLRCPHCFVVTPEAPKTWEEMDLGEYEQFFTKARGLFSLINITGGEPTLHKSFGQVVLAAARTAAIPNVNIFTNGLLPERLFQALDLGLRQSTATFGVQLSIDGSASFHNQNRGVHNALEKTLHTMKRLRLLKQEHPGRIGRLAAATALSKKNLEELPAIIDLVRQTGFFHSFTFVRSSKIGVSNLKYPQELSEMAPYNFPHFLSVPEMKHAIKVIGRHLWSRHPGSLYYATNRVTLETIAASLQDHKPRAACMSGLAEFVLLPNGDVARCEMLRPAANVRHYDYDPAKVITSEAYRRNYQRTRGCWCTHDCGIGISIMYSQRQLANLFEGERSVPDTATPRTWGRPHLCSARHPRLQPE